MKVSPARQGIESKALPKGSFQYSMSKFWVESQKTFRRICKSLLCQKKFLIKLFVRSSKKFLA